MEPIKYWSAEFLEQRMADHKRWQEQTEHAQLEEVIDAVQALPYRPPRKSGRLFELKPEHVQSRAGERVQ